MSCEVIVFLPGSTASTLVSLGQPPRALLPVWRTQVAGLAVLRQTAAALSLLESELYPGIVPLGTEEFPSSYQVLVQQLPEFPYTCAISPQVSDPPAPEPANWGLPSTISSNALIGFPYDWRQENAVTVKWLQSLLGAIDAASGHGCMITLLAHSMGGLVARGYLEGPGSGDPWFGRIRRLITMGTPHLGAPAAFGAIADDFTDLPNKDSFLETIAWEFVNSSFDSTFELLPPPGNAFLDDDGVQRSIFPFSDLSQSLQVYLASKNVSLADAERAAAFLQTLSYKGAIPYYCLYGTGFSDTPAGYSFNGTTLQVTNGDGDQIVPSPSASFAGTNVAATVAVPGTTHGQLPADPNAISQIRQWLGLSARAVPSAA